MDAAGTIVGAISLGITVCDGIVTYCHAWKHQDDEVRTLKELCVSLKALLQAIEDGVKRSQSIDPNIVGKLQVTLDQCTKHAEAVISFTKPYLPAVAGPTWKMKAKDLAQRLKFPFEKKTLEELKDIMIAYRGNVEIALSLIELDLSLSTTETIATFQTENANQQLVLLNQVQKMSNAVSQYDQRLPSLENNLSERIEHSQRSIETSVSQSLAAALDHRLPVLQSSMVDSKDSIMARLENISAEIQSFKEMVNSTSEDDSQLSSKEDGLTISTWRSSRPNPRKKRGRGQNSTKQTPIGCECQPRIGSMNFSPCYRRALGKDSETFFIHERTCPFWYQSEIVTKYGVDILVFQRFRISGSLNWSRSPYATIFQSSISQNLTCRAVVPWDAPVFKVVWEYLGRNRCEICVHCATSCVRDLHVVFQSGNGSPKDTRPDGTSILEYASRVLNWLEPSSSRIQMVWMFLRELYEVGGVINPFEHTERGAGTLFERVCRPLFLVECADISIQPIAESLCLLAEDYDLRDGLGSGFVTQRAYTGGWWSFRKIIDTLRSNEHFAMATSCGVLSRHVLRRDKSAVTKFLQSNPEYIWNEQNLFGHYPIHLAIGWPDGLALLLESADTSLQWPSFTDPDGCSHGPYCQCSSPLDYAIAYGCSESVRLLADAGLPLSCFWYYPVNTDKIPPEMGKIAFAIIVERWHQLLEFGKQSIPTDRFSSLTAGIDALDLKAVAVFNFLCAENAPIPERYLTRNFWTRGGIFHRSKYLDLTTAMACFDAGCTQVDYEFNQITPLMNLVTPREDFWDHSVNFFRIVEFFIEKGARSDRIIPFDLISMTPPFYDSVRSHRVIHRIAWAAWDGVLDSESERIPEVANLSSSMIWRTILRSSLSDPCNCACTANGCRPISLALKALVGFQTTVNGWEEVYDVDKWKVVVTSLSKLKILIEGLKEDNIAEDVIRLLTFTALGLTHTCCKHMLELAASDCLELGEKMIEVMNQCDAEEIHAEEKDMIAKLDYLVTESMHDFHECGLSLPDFLVTSWQEKMFQALTVKDEFPEEVRRRAEDLGVVFETKSEFDHESGRDEGYHPINVDEGDYTTDPACQCTFSEYEDPYYPFQHKNYKEWFANIRNGMRTS